MSYFQYELEATVCLSKIFERFKKTSTFQNSLFFQKFSLIFQKIPRSKKTSECLKQLHFKNFLFFSKIFPYFLNSPFEKTRGFHYIFKTRAFSKTLWFSLHFQNPELFSKTPCFSKPVIFKKPCAFQNPVLFKKTRGFQNP